MTTIGIIGAMQNEIDKLINFYNLKKDKMNKDIYERNIFMKENKHIEKELLFDKKITIL